MEITERLEKYKFISSIIKLLIQSFFYVVRKIVKLRSIKEGQIVVISLLKLGDTVFTIPAIREIQKHYKKEIRIICFPEVIPIYRLGLLDVSCIPIKHEDFYFSDRFATLKARKILRSQNPEIIFDLNGVMTSATLIFSSRAKTIVGMGREQFKTIYDIFVPENRSGHLMDIDLETIAPIIPIIDKEIIKQFPRSIEKNNRILIHPFAGWDAKEWNLEKYIQIGILLKENYDISFVAPVNSIKKDIIKEITNEGMSFTTTQTVDDLISEIRKCSILIGNDSGAVHIADLLGKSTFCIYGPTNPKFPRPIGNHHSECKSDIKCMPKDNEEFCFTNGGRSGCPAFECMNSLTLEKVYADLSIFLENWNKNQYS